MASCFKCSKSRVRRTEGPSIRVELRWVRLKNFIQFLVPQLVGQKVGFPDGLGVFVGEPSSLKAKLMPKSRISGLLDGSGQLQNLLGEIPDNRIRLGSQRRGGLERSRTLKALLAAWIRAWLVGDKREEVSSGEVD